ncbi:NUDIX hydrolase [Candidatus Saccharibacteria bacterium]|nr:NUDIX hydrolase [Candidatus Saccharibacteria bacterium]
MSRRIAVRAVVVHDDKLFCVRHKAYAGMAERTYWCAPGGGVDEGEELIQALEREIIEEVGIKPKVGNLLYIQQYTDQENGREQLEFFFHVTNTSDFLVVDAQEASHHDIEIEEFDFIGKNDKKKILPKFLLEEDTQAHINSNSPTKIFNY